MRKRYILPAVAAVLAACLVGAMIAGCPAGPAGEKATLQAWRGGWRLGPFHQVVSLAWVSPGELGYRVRYDGLDELGRLDAATGKFRPAVAVGEGPEAEPMYLGGVLRRELGCLYSVLRSEGGSTCVVLRPDGTGREFPTAFYRLSPSGLAAVLFTAPPVLLRFATGETVILPAELAHGWPAYGVGLCWSPDEQFLVYEDWSADSLVILRTTDGGEVARIGDEGWSSIAAAWSPDGKRIAFLSWPTGEPYAYQGEYDFRLEIGRRLGVYAGEGKKVAYIPGRPQVFGRPVWCPESRRVAFQAGPERPGAETDYLALGEIWVHDVVTGETACVTSERSGALGKRPAAWSPQGDRLLFLSTYREEGFGSQVAWVVDLATGLETKVGTPHTMTVTWLPDGRLLRAGPVADGTSSWVVELVDRAGEVTRLLGGARISDVAVSPGGAYVALALTEGENREFVVILPL